MKSGANYVEAKKLLALETWSRVQFSHDFFGRGITSMLTAKLKFSKLAVIMLGMVYKPFEFYEFWRVTSLVMS